MLGIPNCTGPKIIACLLFHPTFLCVCALFAHAFEASVKSMIEKPLEKIITWIMRHILLEIYSEYWMEDWLHYKQASVLLTRAKMTVSCWHFSIVIYEHSLQSLLQWKHLRLHKKSLFIFCKLFRVDWYQHNIARTINELNIVLWTLPHFTANCTHAHATHTLNHCPPIFRACAHWLIKPLSNHEHTRVLITESI